MNNPLFFTLLLLTSYGGYDKIYLERRNVMSIRTIKRDIKYWFQRRIRGWSDDETWNLDYEFIKWVNSRFKKYKDEVFDIFKLIYGVMWW